MTVGPEVTVVRQRQPLDDAVPPAAAPPVSERLHALERLSDVAVRVASSVDLPGTLDAIAAAVVDSLGFDAAVLNLVAGTAVDVVSVAGPAEVKDALLGTSQQLETWQRLLERSCPLGGLRFVDGRRDDGSLEGLLAWVPDLEVSDDPETWHPHDALFAPLLSPVGDLVGVLSVDLPRDGRRPGAATIELLERFAVMAALAIERAKLHQRIADSAALFQRLFEGAPLAMALLELDGRIARANTRYAERVQRPVTDLVGACCWDLVDEAHREPVRRAILAVARGYMPLYEGEMRSVDGQRWSRATASRIDSPAGPRLLVQLVDVTEQRRATAMLEEQALTDALTGLYNRAGLHRHLDALLERRRRVSDGDVAVLFCDLDMFKAVNDTHGHAAGDALLVHTAAALQHELRDTDHAARFGGDEFVVVLDSCDGVGGAVVAAERMMHAVGQALELGGVRVTSSMSVGIALATPGADTDALLAAADAALYRAKANGRNRWELA